MILEISLSWLKTINVPATQSRLRNLLLSPLVAGPVALVACLGNLQLESKMVSWVGHIGAGEVWESFAEGSRKKCEAYSRTPMLPTRLLWHSVRQILHLKPLWPVEYTQERKVRGRPGEWWIGNREMKFLKPPEPNEGLQCHWGRGRHIQSAQWSSLRRPKSVQAPSQLL